MHLLFIFPLLCYYDLTGNILKFSFVWKTVSVFAHEQFAKAYVLFGPVMMSN